MEASQDILALLSSNSSIAIAGTLLSLLLLSLLRGRLSKHGLLPPGPKGYPFIGNLLELAKAERPHILFSRWSKAHGSFDLALSCDSVLF